MDKNLCDCRALAAHHFSGDKICIQLDSVYDMSNHSQSNSRHGIFVTFHSQLFCLHSEMYGENGGSSFPCILDV